MLRRTKGFLIIIFVAAHIAGLMPFLTFIRDETLFGYQVLILGLASLAAVHAGALAASRTLQQCDTDLSQYILIQWRITFRQTCRYQWWLFFPYLGMAYTLTQLYGAGIPQYRYWWFFFRQPYTYWVDSSDHFATQIEGWLITAFVILGFMLAEAGLIAAFAVLLANYKTSVSVKAGITLMVRFSLLFAVIPVVSVLYSLYITTPDLGCSTYSARVDRPQCTVEQSNSIALYGGRNRRIGETVHAGILTIVGRGAMLSANIMRPNIASYRHSIECDCYYPVRHDNRPFVLRQVVAGVLGLLMYGGLTGGVLWLSSKRASPP